MQSSHLIKKGNVSVGFALLCESPIIEGLFTVKDKVFEKTMYGHAYQCPPFNGFRAFHSEPIVAGKSVRAT